MKVRNIIMLALAATLTLGATASQPAKDKKGGKKAKTTAVTTAETAPQPLDADVFSYNVGLAQSTSLKQYITQSQGVDSLHYGDFVDALNGKYSEAEIAKMKAVIAGVNIKQQNEQQVFPNINKAATGSADSAYLNKDLFVKGLIEGLQGTAAISADSATTIADQQFKYQEYVVKTKNQAYYDAYAQMPGVKKTESGLLYKVIQQGEGAVPADTNQVEVNYEGELIDGTVFDSSYKRNKPATFGVTQVIKGWTEALKMMPVGSTYELCIPYNLAYGERGNRNIPPYSTLKFKVELLSIKK